MYVYLHLLQNIFLRKREVCISNSKSMVRIFFTYVYVYWIRTSDPKHQGVTNVHLFNVHFVLREISAFAWPFLGLVIATTLSHLVQKQ